MPSWRVPRASFLLLALLPIAFLAPGCRHGHCSAASGGGGTPAANVGPIVQVTSPTTDLQGAPGDVVTIRWIDDDPDDVATTDLIARPLATADGVEEYPIAMGALEADGEEQSASWDTLGVPEGTYRIEARTTDGKLEATAIGAGLITLVVDDGKGEGGGTGGSAAGGSGKDIAYGVDTFDDGSYVVAGVFDETMLLGAGEPNQTALSSTGITEAFLARHADDGSLLWARGTHSSRWAGPSEVASLSDGSIAWAGLFSHGPGGGEVVISGGESDAQTLVGPPTPGVNAIQSFVARLDENGGLLWAKAIVASWQVRLYGVTTTPGAATLPLDSAGDGILVTGFFEGAATFAPGESEETTVSVPVGRTQFFVARYESDGRLAFVKTGQSTGSYFHQGRDIDAFPDGSFVLGVKRAGTLTLGAGEHNETTIGSGSTDLVVRYHADGTLDWVRAAAGSPSATSLSTQVAALLDGTTVAAISFSPGAVSFPGATIDPVLVEDENRTVIVRFDADGEPTLAKVVAGVLADEGHGDRMDGYQDGGVLLTGYLQNHSEVFGAGEINETLLEPSAGNTAYMARYNADLSLDWARAPSATSHTLGLGAATFANGQAITCGYFFGSAIFENGFGTVELTSMGQQDAFAVKQAASVQ